MVADNFNAGLRSTVSVEEGGIVGDNLEAVGAEVTISGGSVGNGFQAWSGSQVTISGGSVGNGFHAWSGSQVTISGGSVESFLRAFSGSQVTFSSGSVEYGFSAGTGSQVTMTDSNRSRSGEPGQHAVKCSGKCHLRTQARWRFTLRKGRPMHRSPIGLRAEVDFRPRVGVHRNSRRVVKTAAVSALTGPVAVGATSAVRRTYSEQSQAGAIRLTAGSPTR